MRDTRWLKFTTDRLILFTVIVTAHYRIRISSSDDMKWFNVTNNLREY